MRLIIFFATLTLTFTLSSTAFAQDCAGFESRMQPGMMGRVTPGDPNNVRANPTAGADLIGQLDGGTTFLVTGESICADGFTWLPVSNERLEISGYTVEGTDSAYWTEPATIEILRENFAMDFKTVSDNVTVSVVPASDNFDYYRDGGHPAFIQITLYEAIFSEFLTPEIRIYPIGEFEAINEAFHLLIDCDLACFTEGEELPLPFPMYTGAARLHESHAQLIESPQIIGTRYIALFGQTLKPILGGEMFYTFQGITRDERYWIYALLPLRAPALDSYYYDNRADLDDDGWITWDGSKVLDEYAANLADDTFFPTLGELDDVMASLNFYGTEGMPAPVIDRLPDYTIDLTPLGEPGFLVEDGSMGEDILNVCFGPNETDVFGWIFAHNSINMSALHMMGVIRFLTNFLAEAPATFNTIRDHQGAITPVLGGIRYIENDTLTGIFYIPAPRGIPITGGRLTYEFQGMTKDGDYYLRGGYSVMTDFAACQP